MSFLLPLAILSLSAIAAPVPDLASHLSRGIDPAIPGLAGPLEPRGITVPTTSLNSDTSVTDVDAGLLSVLQASSTTDPVPDSCLCSWVSLDGLVEYLGTGYLGQPIPATDLAVKAGGEPEAWVSVPDSETNSQTVANLETSYWVSLDDLVCSLTKDTLISVESILLYQPDSSSDVAVYVSFADCDSALSTLTLDHTLDTYLYSDLGLGNYLDPTMPYSDDFSSDIRFAASTPAEYETDLLAPKDDPATENGSDLHIPVSVLLDSDTAGGLLDPTYEVASDPSDLSGLGVPTCS